MSSQELLIIYHVHLLSLDGIESKRVELKVSEMQKLFHSFPSFWLIQPFLKEMKMNRELILQQVHLLIIIVVLAVFPPNIC